ncbi:MAG: peptidylprolyl isomerase [Polyangiaceae bacterium]
MRSAPTIAAIFAVIALSCGHEPPAAIQHVSIGANVVARAGNATISAPLVVGVARTQHRDADAALDALVRDALLADDARAKKIDLEPANARDLTALQAKLVADRIALDAKRGGPGSDADVDELSKIHARDVDAPEEARVIHAIAIRPKKADESQIAKAKAVAEELEKAVQGATSDGDFEARANAVPHEGVDVRVERLPPFAADGTVGSGGAMDATFANAAFALTKPGEISPVIESSFGWHVIRLDERIPAKHVAREERRTMFAEECVTRRARAAFSSLIAAKRAALPVEISRDAEEAMAAVAGAASSP